LSPDAFYRFKNVFAGGAASRTQLGELTVISQTPRQGRDGKGRKREGRGERCS